MSRRGARLTIAVLFALACGAAAWQYLRLEHAQAARADAAAAFERDARTLVTAIAELRGAQQAYVAAGQGIDYWTTRVARNIASLHARLDALRQTAAAPEAVASVAAASTALDGFARMDSRARDYATADQRLLASDLIFGNGFEMTHSIAAEIETARSAEASFRETDARRLHNRQQVLAAGVAGLAFLFLLILAFAPGPPSRPQAAEPPTTRMLDLAATPAEEDNVGRSIGKALLAIDPPVAASAVDLRGAADLCLDLARVSDAEEIPALLERVARVLEAKGIVLWIADPDGRELVPTAAHGYPAPSLARLGSILRDADNATAAAFREARVRTVRGDMLTNGAVVAPLITPGGCIGVMAAEVRNEREQRDEVRAVASIVAAQLATLIGITPIAPAHAKAN